MSSRNRSASDATAQTKTPRARSQPAPVPAGGEPTTRAPWAPIERRPLLVLMAVVCLIFVASYTSRLAEYRRLQLEKAAVEKQIVDSEAKSRVLAAELAYVKSPEFVEEMAVTQLGMAREGDQVLTLIDAQPAVPAAQAGTEAEAANNAVVPAQLAQGADSPADRPVDALDNDDGPIWQQWVSVFVGGRD